MLFDAVLDALLGDIADNTAAAARAAGTDPVATLCAGCLSWLHMAQDAAVQRIVLIDAPSVVGWHRVRELDQQHALGRLRANLNRIATSGSLPDDQIDIMAHMLLAAIGEAALLIARAENQQAALENATAAVTTLIDRLVSPARPPGLGTF